MNLCEALKKANKKGCAIRRSAWKTEYAFHGVDNILRYGSNAQEIPISIALLMATDWELCDAPYHGYYEPGESVQRGPHE